MSSFFTMPAAQRKRKRQDAGTAASSKKRTMTATRPRPAKSRPKDNNDEQDGDDESISGSESSGNERTTRATSVSSSGSSAAQDTAAERRLKLAERYLENIRAEVGEEPEVGFDAADVDRDLIAARLKEDVAEEQGKLFRHVARQLDYEQATHTAFRANTLATTGVATCGSLIYTVSKDMTLIKWRAVSPPHVTHVPRGQQKSLHRKKPKQLIYTKGDKNKQSTDTSYLHHTKAILCVAASADGQFVATGGADRRLIVWDAATLRALKVFTQHRDAVLALAFRGRSNQLFSASKDRTVKIWALDQLAYVETLFGHQDEVVDVAAVGGREERCVSVGARDRSARLWKVVDENQLVFRGGGGGGEAKKPRTTATTTAAAVTVTDVPSPLPAPELAEGSLDRVIQLTTQLFVTGSDAGTLSLYSLARKKPLHSIPRAHGFDAPLPPAAASAELDAALAAAHPPPPTPRWITALAAVPGSDAFVSGSWDGAVRVWAVSADQRRLEAVAALAVGPGVVNDLAARERGERGADGLCVVAAVGAETRLGRWKTCGARGARARNGAVLFELPRLGAARAAPGKVAAGEVDRDA